MEKFIVTHSKEAADELKRRKFPLISELNGKYVFQNNMKVTFSENTAKSIAYTNRLTM